MGLWGDGIRSPWLYAEDILALRTRDARRAALAAVPTPIRELVRAQVLNDAWVVGNWARRVAAGLPPGQVPAAVRRAALHMGIDLEALPPAAENYRSSADPK